jgi:hypothetical protein
MKNSILEQVRLELKNSVDEKTLDTAQHFFKEQITAYGVNYFRHLGSTTTLPPSSVVCSSSEFSLVWMQM